MLRNRKYVFDLSDLQYKLVKLHWKVKLLRFFLWFSVSIIIAVLYGTVFENIIVSPKEKMLSQQVENMKLQYSLIGRELDNSIISLNSFRLSDDRRYRPILEMDSIPESYRMAGYGGIDRFRDMTGYMNSDLFISTRSKIEKIKNMANVQNESFKTVAERSAEWKREMDHLPIISPVDVKFRLGDGFRLRIIHPVLGTSRKHNGQDFPVPYGTEVYATGDGKVIESGWNSGGFGNCIVIDHGYGLQTTYGHLSNIKVAMGMNVKRGDLIGLSGSTGLSSGPHLHYQIDKFGQHMNPVNFFNNDISVEEYNEMIQTLESESKFR
ncbi:MAG: M23 family metallopeptidase [Bacteroidia bacterium]|nr:M23 family metallopeptidase [Bacteroidia bacterium]